MKSFISTDPSNHNSENTWYTPKSILNELCSFDMDVCTNSNRPFDIAKTHVEFDKGQNTFDIQWNGFVWMNPPYGKEIDPFIQKFIDYKFGIALVFARMGSRWMQKFLKKGDGIYFLRKRVRFIDKNGIQHSNAGTDSCLLLMGDYARAVALKTNLEGVLIDLNY